MAKAGSSRRDSTGSHTRSGSTSVSVRWEMISPAGPVKCHHVGCVINNTIYIHGGIEKQRSTVPLNTHFAMDLETGIWRNVTLDSSPALSHHACVAMENRYMVLIGGWDGKTRISALHIFDTQEQRWLCPNVSGFPSGAGLSSHTATLLQNGDVFIVGREGSLRTQRRAGNAYLLCGHVLSHNFTYTSIPMGIDSRSGHTAECVGSILHIIGGRDDKLIEMHGKFKVAMNTPKPQILSQLSSAAHTMNPMSKWPCGRKNHIAVAAADGILIHGGETFDGRSREPVAEMYFVRTKGHIQWVKLGSCLPGRAGHVVLISNNKVMIHGGEGQQGCVYGDLYQLML